MKIEKAGKILSSFIGDLGNDLTIRFIQEWEKIIGEACAAHSRIRDIKKDHLLIEVDNPAWLMHMHEHQEHYLRRLKNTQKSVRSIRFILGHKDRMPQVPAPPPNRNVQTSETPASTPQFPQDEKLQDQFRHIADMINNQETE